MRTILLAFACVIIFSTASEARRHHAPARHYAKHAAHKPIAPRRRVLVVRAPLPAPLGFEPHSGLSWGDWAGLQPGRYRPAPDPVRVEVREMARGYLYTGVFVLSDPESGLELGRYQFATGGAGRGSAPWGEYEIGAFRNDGFLGPRWEVNAVGRTDGEVWDPRIGKLRDEIQLHAGDWGLSLGCFAVSGGQVVWRDFVSKMDRIIEKMGRVTFTVGRPPDAQMSASE